MSDDTSPAPRDEAERFLIGGLLHGDLEALALIRELGVTAGVFTVPKMGALFEAICALADAGATTDYPTVAFALAKRAAEVPVRDGEAPAKSLMGALEISNLADAAPSAANAAYFARIVLESQRRAELTGLAGEVYGIAKNDPGANGRLTKAIGALSDLSVAPRAGERPTRFDAEELMAVWQERFTSTDIPQIEIPTGFRALDEVLRGLHRGEYVVIAGRTSHGKSALALQIARAAAQVVPVTIMSLEDRPGNLSDRLVAQEGNLCAQAISSRTLTGTHIAAALGAAARLSELPLVVEDRPGADLVMIAGLIRANARKGAVVCVVDYLQLVGAEKAKNENDERVIARISTTLKTLARELNICVVAVSQMNRKGDERDEWGAVRHPRLTDIRGSGQIEQDADVVLIVSRPECEGKKDGDGRKAVLAIAKHRNGAPKDDIGVWFNQESVRFIEGPLPRTPGEDD